MNLELIEKYNFFLDNINQPEVLAKEYNDNTDWYEKMRKQHPEWSKLLRSRYPKTCEELRKLGVNI